MAQLDNGTGVQTFPEAFPAPDFRLEVDPSVTSIGISGPATVLITPASPSIATDISNGIAKTAYALGETLEHAAEATQGMLKVQYQHASELYSSVASKADAKSTELSTEMRAKAAAAKEALAKQASAAKDSLSTTAAHTRESIDTMAVHTRDSIDSMAAHTSETLARAAAATRETLGYTATHAKEILASAGHSAQETLASTSHYAAETLAGAAVQVKDTTLKVTHQVVAAASGASEKLAHGAASLLGRTHSETTETMGDEMVEPLAKKSRIEAWENEGGAPAYIPTPAEEGLGTTDVDYFPIGTSIITDATSTPFAYGPNAAGPKVWVLDNLQQPSQAALSQGP